jgi:hypothetical protein
MGRSNEQNCTEKTRELSKKKKRQGRETATVAIKAKRGINCLKMSQTL